MGECGGRFSSLSARARPSSGGNITRSRAAGTPAILGNPCGDADRLRITPRSAYPRGRGVRSRNRASGGRSTARIDGAAPKSLPYMGKHRMRLACRLRGGRAGRIERWGRVSARNPPRTSRATGFFFRAACAARRLDSERRTFAFAGSGRRLSRRLQINCDMFARRG